MTKSELIAKLAARYPQLVAKDAELAVKMVLDAMGKSLSEGQRIEIRGFGSFGLHHPSAAPDQRSRPGQLALVDIDLNGPTDGVRPRGGPGRV